NFFYWISYLANRKRLFEIVRKENPDILHAQSIFAGVFFAKKLSKEFDIPYVVTLRGLRKIDRHLARNLSNAKQLIAINNADHREAVKKFSNPVKLIPHGIDEQFFSASSFDNRPNDILKIVTVCRLVSMKNVDLVI